MFSANDINSNRFATAIYLIGIKDWLLLEQVGYTQNRFDNDYDDDDDDDDEIDDANDDDDDTNDDDDENDDDSWSDRGNTSHSFPAKPQHPATPSSTGAIIILLPLSSSLPSP